MGACANGIGQQSFALNDLNADQASEHTLKFYENLSSHKEFHVRLIAKIEQLVCSLGQLTKRFKLKSLIMAQIERWRQA